MMHAVHGMRCSLCGYSELNTNWYFKTQEFLIGWNVTKIYKIAKWQKFTKFLSSFQALILWSVLSEGIELDRLGDGGVFSILDNISEAVAKFDLAGSGPEGEPFADIAAKNGVEEEDSQDVAVQKVQLPNM